MTGGDVDLPGLKNILWHRMRDDLKRFIPGIADEALLMCPTCCRFLPIEEFGIEHIIPQQALDDDPVDVRAAIPRNMRSETILLCKKRLRIKGKVAYANGCNSWKGRFFDRFLREIFNGKVGGGNFTSRHQISLFSACYLGLFAQYGYQITLVPSGVVMRRQFFNPNKFNRDMPSRYQMVLMGEPARTYKEERAKYWMPPFKFSIEDGACRAVVRNASLTLPLSRDPELPIAFELPFAPPKYRLLPNFETVFE